MARKCKSCSTCEAEYWNDNDILSNTSRWRTCEQGNFWFNCSCGSTMTLRAGDVTWFDPSKPSPSGSLLNLLGNREKFPALPRSVVKIRQSLESEDSSASDIATALKGAPLMAVGILSIANNMKASSGTNITSLEHAISFIGRDLVKQVALTVAVKNIKPTCKVFNLKSYWLEAFTIGAIAEKLVKKFPTTETPDEAYVAGALCNIGKVVGAVYSPETTDSIASETKQGKTWNKSERQITSFNHCKLGEFATSQWGFPHYVCSAANEHHAILKENPPTPPSTTEIVGLANQLMHLVLECEHRMQLDLVESLKMRFNLDNEGLHKLADDFLPVREHAQKLVEQLS